MTMEQGQLFDPDNYGPGTPPRQMRMMLEPIVEPLAPGYIYLRDKRGMLPYAHLIGGVATNSAATTLCGRVGTRVINLGVEVMIRCPECDLAQQLLG
jgi:hypothetical protein